LPPADIPCVCVQGVFASLVRTAGEARGPAAILACSMTNEESNAQGPRRKWLVLGGVTAVVALLAALLSTERKDVPVRAYRIHRQTMTSGISTNGRIRPIENFAAYAPAATTVTRILVHEGDKVRPGQFLIQLDDLPARAQAAKAEAQLRAAGADLEAVRRGGTQDEILTTQSRLAKAQAEAGAAQRNLAALRQLQQEGAASAGEVAAAENRMQAAEADLKLAQKQQSGRYSAAEVERAQAQAGEAQAALLAAEDVLRHSAIRVSGAGTVYSLPVRPGQFVNAGDLLIQAADLSSVEVVGYVDEPDLGRLRPGEAVEIKWDALPGRAWEGVLTRVPSTVVAVGSRNVGEITCRVSNSDAKLLPNINVNVNIITAEAADAVVVPREAVHAEDGQRFVFAIEAGKLRRHDVQTGISNLTEIEITQGLAEGVEVALGAYGAGQALWDGMPVKVISQ